MRHPDAFDAAQLRRLRETLRSRTGEEPVPCPACGADLSERAVPPPPDLPYVRRRVWAICPACGRTGAVDV